MRVRVSEKAAAEVFRLHMLAEVGKGDREAAAQRDALLRRLTRTQRALLGAVGYGLYLAVFE